MTNMITVKISPKAAKFLQERLTDYVHEKMKERTPMEFDDGLADLIAEVRTIQKLKTAYEIHYAECTCCDAADTERAC